MQAKPKPQPTFEQPLGCGSSTPLTVEDTLEPGEVEHQVCSEFDQIRDLPKELPSKTVMSEEFLNHDGTPLEAEEEDFHSIAHYEFYLRGLKL